MNIKLNINRLQKTKQILRIGLGVLIILGILGMNGSLGLGKVELAARAAQDAPEAIANVVGVEMIRMTQQWGVDKLTDTGIPWVRLNGLVWSNAEPIKNVRQWDPELEADLKDAANRGMQVVLVVRGTPTWAQKYSGKTCGPIKQEELNAFAKFMVDAVNKYKQYVKYWEIWNEPDIPYNQSGLDPNSFMGCWGDDAYPYGGGEYYADMLKAIWQPIKSADPQAKILVGGLQMDCGPDGTTCTPGVSAKFFEGILKNLGGPYFDGVAFHAFDYYGGKYGEFSNTNWGSSWKTTGPVTIAKANHLKKLLAENNVTGKFLVNSEAALLCMQDCGSTFELTKASYVAQVYVASIAADLRTTFWYAMKAGWRESDLLDYQDQPRPAYYALNFVNDELANVTFTRKLDSLQTIAGYEFRRGDRAILALWSQDGNINTLMLPSAPLLAYDVDGDLITVGNRVAVGLEPFYLEYEYPLSWNLFLPTTRRSKGIENGDFERGVSQGVPPSWTLVNGGLGFSIVSSSPTSPKNEPLVPNGSYTALLGRTNFPCTPTGVPVGHMTFKQQFTVPDYPDDTPPKLMFDYIIYSQDGGANQADYDRFEVYLESDLGKQLVFSNGHVSGEGLSCSNWHRVPTSGWGTGSIDLMTPIDYRGKTITVYFENWNRKDGWYNTFTYLDNVRVSR